MKQYKKNMKPLVVILSLFLAGSSVLVASKQFKKIKWPFDGVFGYVDKSAAQRGFQVYKEICACCHSMSHLRYKDLEKIGFSAEEIKTIASESEIIDGPDDKGNLFKRKRTFKDKFANPYSNEQEARFSNNGNLPPDLSLITKARFDGENHVYNFLTGYIEKNGEYYNKYLPEISMPFPFLSPVVYQDGTEASIEQMSKDVVIFLQWTAEPEMGERKSLGLKVLIFLFVTCIVLFITKKKIWEEVKT